MRKSPAWLKSGLLHTKEAALETFSSDPRDPRTGVKAMYRLYGRLTAALDRRLATCGFNPSQRRVLIELGYSPALTDARLARALGIDRSQLSRTMAKLISSGLVEAEPNPAHGGQRLLRLTSAGLAEASLLDQQWMRAINAQLADLEDHELALVTDAMGARVYDLREAEKYAVEIRPLTQKGLCWLLGGAGTTLETASIANSISRFLTGPDDKLGFEAVYFQTVVGACMIVVDESNLEFAQVEGFSVEPAIRDLPVGSELLGHCLHRARELTIIRVNAVANSEDPWLDRVYRGAGFIRSREKVRSFRHGPAETLRLYRHQSDLPGAIN